MLSHQQMTAYNGGGEGIGEVLDARFISAAPSRGLLVPCRT